jgi:hypothetical protein
MRVRSSNFMKIYFLGFSGLSNLLASGITQNNRNKRSRLGVHLSRRMPIYIPTSKALCCIAGAFLLGAGALVAQPSSTWISVKALSPGTQVRITAGSQTLTGQFQVANDESIAITSAKGQEMFARQQVTKVAAKKEARRPRNTLIGFVAGAGTGLAAGAITDSKCVAGSCFLGTNFGKAVLIPAGAILGLGLGFAWPTGGWRTVYHQ